MMPPLDFGEWPPNREERAEAMMTLACHTEFPDGLMESWHQAKDAIRSMHIRQLQARWREERSFRILLWSVHFAHLHEEENPLLEATEKSGLYQFLRMIVRTPQWADDHYRSLLKGAGWVFP